MQFFCPLLPEISFNLGTGGTKEALVSIFLTAAAAVQRVCSSGSQSAGILSRNAHGIAAGIRAGADDGTAADLCDGLCQLTQGTAGQAFLKMQRAADPPATPWRK